MAQLPMMNIRAKFAKYAEEAAEANHAATATSAGEYTGSNLSISGNFNAGGTIEAQGKITSGGDIEQPHNYALKSGNNMIKVEDSNNKILLDGNTVVDGDFTANEIVEKMTGYSATLLEFSNAYSVETIYYGACKNGNKLTLVYAFNITKTAENSGYQDIAKITVPDSVYSKLYPSTMGGGLALSFKVISAIADDTQTFINIPAELYKSSGVVLSIASTSNMVLNQKYYFRYEETFLLSDSLVS